MERQVLDTIDLNIGDNYLYDWTECYAIREIIANALDEQRDGKVKIIEKSNDEYIIRDYGSGLKIESFIMSGSNKISKNDVIGKFGVGLKDALGVLYNHEIEVEIMTEKYIFELRKKAKSKITKIETLHVYVYRNDKKDFIGTQFTLRKCKKEYIEQAKEEFLLYKSSEVKILESTKHGDVIEKKGNISDIYINGMKIAQDENLTFSYNIKNMSSQLKSAINRERKYVSRDAYREDIKKIICECKAKDILDTFEKQLKRTYSASNYSEIKWNTVLVKEVNYIIDKYSNKQVRFISNDDRDSNNELYEILCKSKDTEVIMVSPKIKDDIRKYKKDIKDDILFINDSVYIEEVLLKKEDLNDVQREVLQESIDILKKIETLIGYSILLDNVNISTIQIGSIYHEQDGIIIPISSLINVETCALKIINILSCFGRNSNEFKDMLVSNLIKLIHEGKFNSRSKKDN